MTWANDVCPFSLEPLRDKAPETVFTHREIGMDLDALYAYLLHAVYFTNPVTRVPFEIQDIENIETAFLELHGPGAIEREPTMANPGVAVPDIGPEPSDWMSDSVLLPRVNITVRDSAADFYRLHVDLEVPGWDSVPPRPAPTMTNGEDDSLESFHNVHPDGSNIKLPVASIIKLFLDSGREGRMRDEIDLITYLTYEAINLVRQMLDTCCDVHFQSQVWMQTSPVVMDTIRRHIANEPSGEEVIAELTITPQTSPPSEEPSIQLEVVYTDQWEIYRIMLLQILETRYRETCRDIHSRDRDEYRVALAQHRAMAHEEKVRGNNVDLVEDILNIISRELVTLE